MVLVPDTVDSRALAVVPEQILTSNSLTIIKASGNMTADAKFALADGIMQGKKICLHPSYNLTTSVNYSHSIDIVTFMIQMIIRHHHLLLQISIKQGGQTLNILWIKNGALGGY